VKHLRAAFCSRSPARGAMDSLSAIRRQLASLGALPRLRVSIHAGEPSQTTTTFWIAGQHCRTDQCDRRRRGDPRLASSAISVHRVESASQGQNREPQGIPDEITVYRADLVDDLVISRRIATPHAAAGVRRRRRVPMSSRFWNRLRCRVKDDARQLDPGR
jgi:hypothetical protein